MPVGLLQVKGVDATPFLNGFSGGKSIFSDLVPPLAKFAAVIGPPPELDEVLELELDELELLEEELELLLEEELELRPLELELLELLLEEELELLEPLEVSPPQPRRLSTGTATAAVLIILTILRREAVAVGAVDSSMSILVIVFTIRG